MGVLEEKYYKDMTSLFFSTAILSVSIVIGKEKTKTKKER
jgi:hypothetical protein